MGRIIFHRTHNYWFGLIIFDCKNCKEPKLTTIKKFTILHNFIYSSSAEFIREKLKKLTSEFVSFFLNDTILSVRSGLLTIEAAILSFLECTLNEVVGEQLNDEYTEMVKSQLMVIAEQILANPDLFA